MEVGRAWTLQRRWLPGAIVRTLFRRPWTVEADSDDGERRTRPVVGWRAAGRAAEDWADELRLGIERQ